MLHIMSAVHILQQIQAELVKSQVHDADTRIHFLQINDYNGVRQLYGKLLAEIQRITSEGDYPAAKEMVETYAVKVNPELHKEVRERYAGLHLAPYKGFVNPVMTAVRDKEGNITDVKLDFTEGYVEQHLRYSRDYSNLPDVN